VLAQEVFGVPCPAHGCQTFFSNRSRTGGTLGREERVIVEITIRQTILLTISVLSQRFATDSTAKAVRMPGMVQGLQHFISDREFTSVTLREKHLLKVFIAIRLSVLLFEVVWTQRYSALIALKAVRVPLTAHRYQWRSFNRKITFRAFWRKQFVVILFAIRLSVLLEKVIRSEGSMAFIAVEALGMPVHAHRLHHSRRICNGKTTPGTGRGEQSVVIEFAIRFAVLLIIVRRCQRFGTGGALEAQGVPVLTHLIVVLAISYRQQTPGAFGREEFVVVVLAIRFAVLLIEVIRA